MASIVERLFLKFVPLPVLEQRLRQLSVDRCLRQVVKGESSRFYPEAKVYNLQSNPSKIGIGEDSRVKGELLIFAYGGEIRVGSNSYIGEGTRIWSASSVEIGSNVLISHNCNIIDTDSHEIDHLERAKGFKGLIHEGHSKEKGNIASAPIRIHDHAWISYGVSVLKGVSVGKGAIVAAGSVVTKDVPEFTVVAGNPAVVVKNLQ